MPRPRKNDPSGLLLPLLEEFTRELATVVEARTIASVNAAIREALGSAARGGSPKRRSRATVLCYYPGCKNIAAPRFGMFCAAEHKGLSRTEKEKYRALHGKGSAGKKTVERRAKRISG